MGSGVSHNRHHKVTPSSSSVSPSKAKQPLKVSMSYGGEIINNNDPAQDTSSPPSTSIMGLNNCVTMKQPGGVATMIIKVGQEEYMNYDGASPVVYGKLGDLGDAHPLFKDEFVLLRDHQIDSAEPETLLDSCLEMYVSQQLNQDQISTFSKEHSHKDICVISLRDEPVFFLSPDKADHELRSCHLYSHKLRKQFTPPKQVTTTELCKDYELHTRKEIANMATAMNDNIFYYYQSSIPDKNTPNKFSIQADDDLLTLSEMMSAVRFSHSNIQYVRCPLPHTGLPDLSSIDNLVEIIDQHNGVLVIEDKDTTTPRSQFTACLAYIVRQDKPPEHINIQDKKPSYSSGRWLDSLLSLLPGGRQNQLTVDRLLSHITSCIHTDNLAHNWLSKLSRIQEQGSLEGLSTEDVGIIQMYAMLITFNSYWNSNKERSSAGPFSEWLRRNCPILSQFRSTTSPLNINISTSPNSPFSMVCNSAKSDDYMGTNESVNCANVRKVPGLPIYGLTQPGKKGFCRLNDWLIRKYSHTSTLLITLSDIPMIMCGGDLYSLRYRNSPDHHVGISHVTAEELSTVEKEIVSSCSVTEHDKLISNNDSTALTPNLETIESVYTKNTNVKCLRLPIPTDKAPAEKIFDRLRNIMEDLLQEESNGDNPAIVFCCETGKERTTTAMAIAGIIYSNQKGYPYGAGKGEAERISMWDAQFTKGEFKVIQRITSSLSSGHQSKREVDFILDQCFETSSMMHYHAREEIFVTVKKKQKLKANLEKQSKVGTRDICVRGQVKAGGGGGGGGIHTDIRAYYNKLHRQSLDNLERYAMLIVFNCYLNVTKSQRDKLKSQMSFTDWLYDVGYKCGMLDILDNLVFSEFEPECGLRTRLARNCHFSSPNTLSSHS